MFRKYFLEIILISMVLLFSLLVPCFFTVSNLVNVLFHVCVIGIMATGLTVVLISGSIDLSFAAVAALAAVGAIRLQHLTVGVAIVISLGFGLLVGLANGLLVTKAKINSFVATFGAMLILEGVAVSWVGGGESVMGTSESFLLLGQGTVKNVPFAIFIYLGITFICYFLLNFTTFGRKIYAVGGSEEVCFLEGIRVSFLKTASFLICSSLAAFSGLIMASRLNVASSRIGYGELLTVFAAVLLGGTSLEGGIGSAWRTLEGVLILGFLDNVFNLMGIFSYYQLVIKGLVLITVVAANRFLVRRSNL